MAVFKKEEVETGMKDSLHPVAKVAIVIGALPLGLGSLMIVRFLDDWRNGMPDQGAVSWLINLVTNVGMLVFGIATIACIFVILLGLQMALGATAEAIGRKIESRKTR